jgi:2,4-dienoyl-CoA reductase-like NADH-dependent reductase (Old Yellow Enzyme family)
MKFGDYPKVKALAQAADFRAHARSLGLDIPCDDRILAAAESPLAAPLTVGRFKVGNRFAVQPMEGWDGDPDGAPSENTIRRWKNFGLSGAKLVWGGEAVAVRHDGRANPNQVTLTAKTQGAIAKLREVLVEAHRAAMGDDRDLVIGLQLTHSGRFARPNDKKRLEPQILYRHPLLDRKFGVPAEQAVMTDGEIRRLIGDYVIAAKRAAECGYDFVDLKHCHGYLGHEFLSAHTRDGDFGGSLENRTRFLRELVAGIRAEAPQLEIGVRISAFDFVPFRPDPERSNAEELGPGIPDDYAAAMPYRYAFGVDAEHPTEPDLRETKELLGLLRDLGIRLVNLSGGSPYYNPHLTRPALYPPSDGYHPPEDPLVGVARHLGVVRELKQAYPDLALMGSGYTYLQEYLPHVAQAVVREGWTDFVGIGRLMLSYPELPHDVLKTGAIQRKRLCRTFSDCTTAPRNGLVSGCYPLDAHYKKSPEAVVLNRIKNPKQAA